MSDAEDLDKAHRDYLLSAVELCTGVLAQIDLGHLDPDDYPGFSYKVDRYVEAYAHFTELRQRLLGY